MKTRKTTNQFIDQAKQRFGTQFDYKNVVYINTKTKVNITCLLHNHTFSISPEHHLTVQSGGCSCCYNEYKRSLFAATKEEFVELSNRVHKTKYDYSHVVYTNAHTKVTIVCPRHGAFSMSPNNHTSHAQRCPSCKYSRGEGLVEHVLKSLNIKYVKQHKFKECKNKLPLPFDFWLPLYNCAVEFQGEQHYSAVPFTNDPITNHYNFELTKLRDKIKLEFCKANNIQLILIKHDNPTPIVNILTKELLNHSTSSNV